MANFEIYTSVTYIGRQYMARAAVADVKIDVANYGMGTAGSDASGNPLPPDLSLTVIPAADIMPITSTFASRAYSSSYCLEFNISLPAGDGLGTSSNLGLIGTVLESSNPAEVGQQFLFAIGNYGDKTKTSSDVWDITAIVNF
jgi:hypothetical protein